MPGLADIVQRNGTTDGSIFHMSDGKKHGYLFMIIRVGVCLPTEEVIKSIFTRLLLLTLRIPVRKLICNILTI